MPGLAREPPPPRILYAEDNDGDVELLRIAFDDRRLRVEVEQVGDGDLAWNRLVEAARAGASPWRLVLLDLNLPRRSGLVLLAGLRDLPPLAQVPVVVITSSEAEEDRRQALSLAPADLLVKPPSFAGFTLLVDRLVRFLA